jgi:hypothetical protein
MGLTITEDGILREKEENKKKKKRNSWEKWRH